MSHAVASRSRLSRRFRFHRHDVEQTIRSDRPGVNSSPHSTQGRGSCATRRAALYASARSGQRSQNRRGRPLVFGVNGVPHASQGIVASAIGAAVTPVYHRTKKVWAESFF
jgi:hypothetical protein